MSDARKNQGQGNSQKAKRFWRNEEGTITIFALLMFVLMLAVGGIAIDVMRYETQRTQLQYTLDRAVLAAAALNQQQNPEAVVRDYFATSGLSHYRLNVDVSEGLNFRRVSATVETDIQSYFMNMFGVHAITAPARGSAEERIMNVEISMVLDISGSMRWNNKLENMQTAANQFVDTVLAANTDEQLVSVSIVPYNGTVNAGSTIASVFTLSNEHDRSNCTRFDAQGFNTTALDPTVAIERLAHFDYSNRARYAAHTYSHCPTSDYGAILPWSQNATDLRNHINGLRANGWTAIDLGMRWGVALLDPSTAPALTQLAAANTVHSSFRGRPAAYSDDETLKVVILMTDGENTQQWDIAQEFKRGNAPVFRDADTGRVSIYLPDWNRYYWPHTRRYHATAYDSDPNDATAPAPVPWVEIWANYSSRRGAGEYFYHAWRDSWRLTGNRRDNRLRDYYNRVRYNSTVMYTEGHDRFADGGPADRNLRAICDAANAAGIIVFTIAFEAGRRGEQVMEHCATTDSHYYQAQGIEISEVFASIAQTITQLRLIQ